MNVEVLERWEIPYKGCDTKRTRPKEFRIVRLENNNLAFCKIDTNPKYLVHEAKILSILNGLNCVPALLHQTPKAIFTTYIKGRLLPEEIEGLGINACIKVGWQILVIVNRIHKKGVVHSDIRPWNFIYGNNGDLYLIDFEYAYSSSQGAEVITIVGRHHGPKLKTKLYDWVDSFQCITDVWKKSPHKIICGVLIFIPWSIYEGMFIALSLQYRFKSLMSRLFTGTQRIYMRKKSQEVKNGSGG